MNINPNFMHEDQKFKLVYGSTNTIWETATLDDSVDPKTIHDGCGSPRMRKANGSLLPTPLWRIPFWK